MGQVDTCILCELAGLNEEWLNATGEEFKYVVSVAAKELGGVIVSAYLDGKPIRGSPLANALRASGQRDMTKFVSGVRKKNIHETIVLFLKGE